MATSRAVLSSQPHCDHATISWSASYVTEVCNTDHHCKTCGHVLILRVGMFVRPSARQSSAAFKQATTSALACEILDRALSAAEADDCYQALKLTKRIIRHEDAVLGRTLETVPAAQHSTPHHRDH